MKHKVIIPLLMTPLLLAACAADETNVEQSEDVSESQSENQAEQTNQAEEDNWQLLKGEETVSHIHGAGFWQEDARPVIATHAGLMEHREDGWYVLTKNRHDYMGFELVEGGFYGSGHPDRRTDFKNPMGVIHGQHHGSTLEERSLAGEADFHYMSAGYAADSLYVYLEEATSELEAGFYRSFDGGETFEPMKLDGVDGRQLAGIVADATEQERVFMYGPSGMIESTDGGDTFEPLIENEMIVTAAADAGRLAYVRKVDASFEGVLYDIEEKKATPFELPELAEGAVPIKVAVKGERILLVTSDNSVYEYANDKWKPLLEAGEIK
ncbi:F510_1955 family glycosylhydrolase [Exiguobacterium algae]|uniref:F510_1955 family glycosylhydrolase n=1 Tax=Exiguobacterium algae TaxID=2751250 RepID=UPI001BE9031B|nr:hypothetical protein [Exiguobacterium algae]